MSAGASRNKPCACGSGRKFKLCHGREVEAQKVPMDPRRHVNSPGIIMLVPTRGRVTVEFLTAANHTDGLPTVLAPIPRKGIVEARNMLVKTAKSVAQQYPVIPDLGWYCLWADDDAFWSPGTVTRMIVALQDRDVDIVAGFFSGRAPLTAPKALRLDGTWPRVGVDGDVQDGQLAEVAKVGFHFVMHRLEVLDRLPDEPFTPEGTDEEGEDFAFCERARAAGLRIWTHTGCLVAHVDDDGVAYLPGEGPMKVVGSQLQRTESTREYEGLVS